MGCVGGGVSGSIGSVRCDCSVPSPSRALRVGLIVRLARLKGLLGALRARFAGFEGIKK